jgi:O-antigen ligase
MAIAVVPLAVSPLGMNQFGPPKLLALALAGSLIGLSFAIEPASFAAQAQRMARSRLAWALAAYFGIASLSVVTSVDRFHSAVGSYPEYQGLLRLVLWAVIAAGAASLAQRQTGWRLIARTVVVTLLAVGAVAWLQKAGIATIGGPGGWSKRAWSTIGNPSHLGVWLVLALPFAAERFFADDHRAWRACAAVSGAVAVVALAWSASRGAMIGFVVALTVGVVLVTRGRPRVERVRIALGGAGALVFVAAVMLLTAGRFARLSAFFDVSAGSAGWRFIIWRTALRIAADRPVLGWGLNTMRFVYPSYRSASALDSPINMGTVADMHNLVLNTAASLGAAGVVALLACVVMAAMVVWRAGDPRAADSTRAVTIGVSLTGFFVAVLFHYPTIDSGTLTAVLLGVLVAFEAGIAFSRSGVTAPVRAQPGAPEALAWRLGAYALSALLIATTLAAASLVAADVAASRALGLARVGAPWAQTRAALSRAEALAPWELAFRKVWATAGTSSAPREGDAAVVTDVNAALDAAARSAPLDSSVQGARGDLMLHVARTSASTRDLNAAEQAYRDALVRDPNNAVYWAGVGQVQYAKGDFAGAVTTFERVVALAGDSPQMWKALAQAYRASGRPQDAERAEARALKTGR